MQVDPLQEHRVNAVILSEAKNLGFRFDLLAAEERMRASYQRVRKIEFEPIFILFSLFP